MLRNFNIIVAKTYLNNGIGYHKNIPWLLKDDLNYFKNITTTNNISNQYNSVIMGKNTFNSIPNTPLKNRYNIIVSNTLYHTNDDTKYIKYVKTLNNAIEVASKLSDNIYIIGGQQIYSEAINHKLCNKLYITDIYNNYTCDTYFPQINNNIYKLTNISEHKIENFINYRFLIYEKNISNDKIYINKEENQLYNLLKNILKCGEYKQNRTDINSISLYSPPKMYYDLSKSFPMITTKKVFLRGIFAELMFNLNGFTDNTILQNQGINIWTGNTTREFLDKSNLQHLDENDLGQTYGFNMRHYSENYINCKTKYINTKINSDQLQYLINLLKYDRDSRRMIINLWDINSLNNCSLPPCLYLFQFNITKDNKLNLLVNLRSSDSFLALNWNIVYCSLFVHLLCNINDINLSPGILSVSIGDSHIYNTYIKAVEEQLKLNPYPPPKLEILNKYDDITKFKYSDIKVIGYKYHENTDNMKVNMVV